MTALPARLADLAGRIGEAAQRAGLHGKRQSLAARLDAGQRLIEAKAQCRHGEWGAVLAHTGIGERTARRWMRLARAGAPAAPAGIRRQRIQGRRYLVALFHPDDRELAALPYMGRTKLLADMVCMEARRNGWYGAVAVLPPLAARKVAASPLATDGGLYVESETLLDMAGGDPAAARRLGRTIRRDLAGKPDAADAEKRHMAESSPIADTLADALAALLGPNAAVFRERPRDWPAIEAAALAIIEGA